jgi:hypothetical protein
VGSLKHAVHLIVKLCSPTRQQQIHSPVLQSLLNMHCCTMVRDLLSHDDRNTYIIQSLSLNQYTYEFIVICMLNVSRTSGSVYFFFNCCVYHMRLY